jgi:hypothetical protein
MISEGKYMVSLKQYQQAVPHNYFYTEVNLIFKLFI